ncbi:arginine/serine-rich coiled-coil protein 2 isoform X2 [Harmonia axyridis]|uniref:arginine/serine-rich coiled-coil protein 2 isoform X2 n=1 Tax=Harmonia axyridis TaxID=115357 RepID=UPI001E277D0D|nr:arginine/serine-rich coiled-coil protein 2 isoform X2 [Harmonia axyridis]
MDSLANYGSDDDYDDSSDEQSKDCHQVGPNKRDPQIKQSTRLENQADANYEEVQMDLSEVRIFQQESTDGSRNGRDNRDKGSGDEKRKNSPYDDRSRENCRNRRGDDRYRDRSRSRERKDEDKMRERKDDRYGSKSDRYSRDYKRDSYRDRKSRRSSSRDKRRSSSRDRRRSTSRERRFSRSPKRDRSRRSRSRSRGRYGGPQRRYGYPKNNSSRNESSETSTDNQGGSRFFMPGITGKYRDQIEKRKLLWQKKEPQKQQETDHGQGQSTSPASTSTRVTKIWEATTFAQDQDGKVASKFKRLMGIKGQPDAAPVPPVDIIKKQEEMFSSMEQQYEVARTATHTMRGVGLGFSSNYPR